MSSSTLNGIEPKITTLLCTFKRPKSLKRAILSALNQTHRNLQVSVFDDASSDETATVVANIMKTDKRLSYHCHAANIGALANFRFAFESIDTPYFSMLSDDDLLVNDFYENAVNVLESNPKIMFVILNSLCVDLNLNLTRGNTCDHKLTYHEDLHRFDAFHSGSIPIDWTAMLFRKEVAHIYLEMDDRYDIATDMRFLRHAVARYNFACLSKVGALFTTHSGSASAARPVMSYVQQSVMISRYVEIINDHQVDPYIRNRAIFYLKNSLSTNEYRRGLKYAMKRLAKNCCADVNCPNEMVENDIVSFQKEGFSKTAKVLNFVYKNRIIRRTIYALFFHYNSNLVRNYNTKLIELQNGEYRHILNNMKMISK